MVNKLSKKNKKNKNKSKKNNKKGSFNPRDFLVALALCGRLGWDMIQLIPHNSGDIHQINFEGQGSNASYNIIKHIGGPSTKVLSSYGEQNFGKKIKIKDYDIYVVDSKNNNTILVTAKGCQGMDSEQIAEKHYDEFISKTQQGQFLLVDTKHKKKSQRLTSREKEEIMEEDIEKELEYLHNKKIQIERKLEKYIRLDDKVKIDDAKEALRLIEELYELTANIGSPRSGGGMEGEITLFLKEAINNSNNTMVVGLATGDEHVKNIITKLANSKLTINGSREKDIKEIDDLLNGKSLDFTISESSLAALMYAWSSCNLYYIIQNEIPKISDETKKKGAEKFLIPNISRNILKDGKELKTHFEDKTCKI